MPATRRMRSPLPTEVPPNFKTCTLRSIVLLPVAISPSSYSSPSSCKGGGGADVGRGPLRSPSSSPITARVPTKTSLHPCRLAGFQRSSFQCLVKIIDQVVHGFQTH